ncbi:hypothetical protein PoB_002518800 [Plakobranchus ocellatus]|uniref:Uncharacterized protein n=1 Tax=Plakobranchus ocellatus TaxID=259542 RepID=A0AAV3ZW80_9GAST|nr:hypothetical protein PoB_002518800 [Plakobranchus ocellatus]
MYSPSTTREPEQGSNPRQQDPLHISELIRYPLFHQCPINTSRMSVPLKKCGSSSRSGADSIQYSNKLITSSCLW